MEYLVDWIIADMLAIHQGSLGHIRYVLKNELKWIPFYGFYFQQVEKTKHKIIKQINVNLFSMVVFMSAEMIKEI